MKLPGLNNEPIHRRTSNAFAVMMLGGFLGGYVSADIGVLSGMVITFVVGYVALSYTPPADEVAHDWIEHSEGLAEQTEGSR